MLFLGTKSGGRDMKSLGLERTGDASSSLAWGDSYQPHGAVGGIAVPDSMPDFAVGRQRCGNKECTGSRTMPWRSRRRPIFEGDWGCSGRCVLTMVRTAVRREYVEALALPEEAPHRHRVPLGLVLLAQGWITHSQLQSALDAQRTGGGRIGERLMAQGGVGREQITRGLSVQWGCPVLTTAGFGAREMALVMPRLFIEEFGVLPVRTAGGRMLYLGFEDRLDPSLALALEQMMELKVESGLLSAEDIRSARASLLAANSVPAKLEFVADSDSLTSRITVLVEEKQPLNARLVRVHRYFWLRLWLEGGTASGVGTLPRSSEDMEDYVFSTDAV